MASAFRSNKSSKRPGVATTRSAPPRKASICGFTDTPPNTARTRRSEACAQAWARRDTCTTNSRVGTSTKALTGRLRVVAAQQAASRSSSGSK